MGIIGLRSPIASHIAYILMMELTDQNYRPVFGLINSGFNGFSIFIVAIEFRYLKDWKTVLLINTIRVGVLILLILIFVP